MPSYDNMDDDNFYLANSRYLSAASTPLRKPPSRKVVSSRPSMSLHNPSTLAHDIDQESANGRHSLAHELAVALMPEPSAGSRLLAEEFGIEYDEGAEGIDEPIPHHKSGLHEDPLGHNVQSISDVDGDGVPTPTFAPPGFGEHDDCTSNVDIPNAAAENYDPAFAISPTAERKKKKKQQLEPDAMVILARDLESTDQFLNHLRRIDIDHSSSSSSKPSLERIASNIIRRINETARDRESQLRELLEYEREFRKISGEVGGTDVLGHLEELPSTLEEDEAIESESSFLHQDTPSSKSLLDVVVEEDDWEATMDRERHQLGDEDDEFGAHGNTHRNAQGSSSSPTKQSFPPPAPVKGPITPAKTLPQLADLRTFTTSLVSTLTTLSEQAQVNGAATTEAGRKIRMLKNKLGDLRTDWDSAEKSRLRIDKWEAGVVDLPSTIGGDNMEGTPSSGFTTPSSSSSKLPSGRRMDGRALVQEHLKAFEMALADAAVKTQAIMTVS